MREWVADEGAPVSGDTRPSRSQAGGSYLTTHDQIRHTSDIGLRVVIRQP